MRPGVRAMPKDCVLDQDHAEEIAHAPLLRMGVTSRETLWLATMIARACVWVNHLRLMGLPAWEHLRVVRDLKAEMERRLLAHHLAATPNHPQRDWWIHRLSEVGEPQMPMQPPEGWLPTPTNEVSK